MAGPNGEYDENDYRKRTKPTNPSGAGCNPKNVAALIEGLAGHAPTTESSSPFGVIFKYDGMEQVVGHPGDQDYLEKHRSNHLSGSAEQAAYENAARKSERLKRFQETSPADIEYFLPPP